MRTLRASKLGNVVESLCLEVSTILPPDVLERLSEWRDREKSSTGRSVLDMILENARTAAEHGVPLCQDTGIFTVYLGLGDGDVIEGDLAGEASAAVASATARGGLRPSVVDDPLGARTNTGDNTPAVVNVEILEGEETRLSVLAKGGGCENASRVGMLRPGAGKSGVLDFVVRIVAETGAMSCPPLVLGVGIGGGFDSAPAIAKKALLSPLDRDNPDKELSRLEGELVETVNRLGIGPGAMGGTVTCIGARVAQAPCHMATLPVAVSVNCHSLRRKTVPLP